MCITLVHFKVYQRHYDISSTQELAQLFQGTLTVTNRTAEFFVNWTKVRKNINKIKHELELWNQLVGSDSIVQDFDFSTTRPPPLI